MLSTDQATGHAARLGFESQRLRALLGRYTRGRTSSVVISRAAVAASGLFTVLLTSRLLSPDSRGIFAALQASVNIMAVCGCASLWLGVSVLLPGAPDARRLAVKMAVLWPVCFSALLAVAALIIGPLHGIAKSGEVSAFLIVSLVGMVYSNLQGVPIGLNRMTAYARAEVLRAATAAVLLGAGIAVAGWRSPIALVLLWGCGSWSLATFYLLVVCRPYVRSRVAGFARAAFSRSIRIHPNSVVWLAVQRLDIVVLAALSTHAQVAYYSLAVAIAEGVLLVPGAIAITGLADYSRLEPAAAAATVARNIKRTLVASGATAVMLTAAGSAVIVLALSAAYRAAILPLAITVVGTTAVSVGQAISPWIAAQLNRPGLSSLIASATLAADMGGLVGAARLGALGAAIASSVAYIGASCGYLAVYHRFRPSAAARSRYSASTGLPT